MDEFRFLSPDIDIQTLADVSYDPVLVTFSVLMAIFASLATCYTVGQLGKTSDPGMRTAWLAGSAVSMGAGTWCMHFLGTLAIEIPGGVRYDGALTILSVLFAIAGSGLAFSLLWHDNRDNSPLRSLIWASLLLGGGFGAMHYTGMGAMRVQAAIYYDPLLFAVSIIVTVGLSVVALTFLLRDIGRTHIRLSSQFVTASTMGLAISVMHYTRMGATYFVARETPAGTGWELGTPYIAVGVCLGLFLLIAVSLTVFLVHRRLSSQEERARQSEGLLSAVIEQVGEGLIGINEHGTIEIFNRAASDIFGYPFQEAIGRDVSMLIPDDVAKGHGDLVRSSQLHGTRDFGLTRQLRGKRKDGSTFPMELLVTGLAHEGDRKFIGVLRDETERYIHEAELISAKHAAEDADRAKSEFLSSMSHEIRTPLNGVLGMASVLLSSELTDEQREQANTIRESGEVLLALLNEILDLSKIEAGHMELEIIDFKLGDMLDTIRAAWEPQLESKGLVFGFVMDPGVPDVLRSDPGRIRQVIVNLISNAEKFTHEGTVTLAISHRALRDGEVELDFSIMDTGIGVSAENQEVIFSDFTQADASTTRRYGGTGLGLSICKNLSKMLGGEIALESVPGEGSTFRFTIRCPIGNPEAVVDNLWENDVPRDVALEENWPLRILIAEDNLVNQHVIRAIIGRAGHQLDIVYNGREAVAAVQRQPYNLVLMDIQMPEMDGVTATQHIRALENDVRNIPIIALTANNMKGDRERFLAAGMTDHVAKPINPRELFAAIQRCTLGGGIAVIEDVRNDKEDRQNDAPLDA